MSRADARFDFEGTLTICGFISAFLMTFTFNPSFMMASSLFAVVCMNLVYKIRLVTRLFHCRSSEQLVCRRNDAGGVHLLPMSRCQENNNETCLHSANHSRRFCISPTLVNENAPPRVLSIFNSHRILNGYAKERRSLSSLQTAV